MDKITFQWDENKNKLNQRKHQISYDAEAIVIDGPEHSEGEERYIILGLSEKANLLVVCHCCRCSETEIRIISARKATTSEKRQYNEMR